MQAAYLMVGTVLKPQGIDGVVKVLPVTDDPARFLDLSTVYIDQKGTHRAVDVQDVSLRGGFVYCRLDGATDRNRAEEQRGWQLLVSRADAVQLPEGRYFIADLIGSQVLDTQGNVLGTLVEILQPGANDVYVIRLPKGRMLLPALKRVVLSIDPVAQRIVLDESLLDEVAVVED